MREWIIFLLFSLSFSNSFAISIVSFSDGVARVVLKNDYPCVYLSNGEKITQIQFLGQRNPNGFQPHYPDGSNQEQCIPFDGKQNLWKYNIPQGVYISDRRTGLDLKRSHMVSFCVEKKNNSIRLVKVLPNKQGGGCSDIDWQPDKRKGFWSRLFGR